MNRNTTKMIINKVTIADEAIGDYQWLTGLCISKDEIKSECEEYINAMNNAGRLLYDYYFKVKYYDENSDNMLMLFLYKSKKFANMQIWKLCGICFSEDWNEVLEDEGHIRVWLNTTAMSKKDDWVVRVRANKILQNTDKALLEDVLEEIEDAFECDRDKEIAKEVALLQSHYFSRRRK